VSTAEQNPDAQRHALIGAGVHSEHLYVDHTFEAKSSRPHWNALYEALRPGDVLVATRLDRVGRSTSHLVTLHNELADRGVAFAFLEQGIDTTTSEGRLMYRMLAAIAEFQRDLIVANTREGLAAARARGRKGRRKPKLTARQVQPAQQLYDAGEKTIGEIAAIFTVPRTTIYGHLDKTSGGGRPRSRKRGTNTTMQANSLAAASSTGLDDPDYSDQDFPRPVRVGLRRTEEPLSSQERELHDRLVRQRVAMRTSRWPSCGNEPIEARERWQQRQDLVTIWLHLDGNAIRERGTAPPGPLITGLHADTPPGLWLPALPAWLHDHRLVHAPRTPLRPPRLTQTSPRAAVTNETFRSIASRWPLPKRKRPHARGAGSTPSRYTPTSNRPTHHRTRRPTTHLPADVAARGAQTDQHGDGTSPIWFTEFGWTTTDSGERRGVMESVQARFFRQASVCRVTNQRASEPAVAECLHQGRSRRFAIGRRGAHGRDLVECT